VDALTDIIRPFSERQGLKADVLRLQREEVLIQVATLARERIRIEQGDPGPVSNKILVPLLEKSSCENPDDSGMVQRWANLLASASMNIGVEPRFVGIMEELSGKQAEVLEAIAFRNTGHLSYPYKVFADSFIENAQHNLSRSLEGFIRRELGKSSSKARLSKAAAATMDKVTNGLNQPGALVYFALFRSDDHDIWIDYDSVVAGATSDTASLSILESLGLIRAVAIRIDLAAGLHFQIEYYHLTELGVNFIEVTARPKVKTIQETDLANRKRGINSVDREF
jgi:hypothetical protein